MTLNKSHLSRFTDCEAEFINRHYKQFTSLQLDGSVDIEEDYLEIMGELFKRKLFENDDFIEKITKNYSSNIIHKKLTNNDIEEIIKYINNESNTDCNIYHYLIKKYFEFFDDDFDFIDHKLITKIICRENQEFDKSSIIIYKLLLQFKDICKNHKETVKVMYKFSYNDSHLTFDDLVKLEYLDDTDKIDDDILNMFCVDINLNQSYIDDIN